MSGSSQWHTVFPERRAVPVLRSLLEAMNEQDCVRDNCSHLVAKLNFLLTQNPTKEVHIDLWLLLLLPGSKCVYLLASSDLIPWKQKKRYKSATRGGREGEETTEIIGEAQTICWTLVQDRKSQNYLLIAWRVFKAISLLSKWPYHYKYGIPYHT